MIPMSHSNSYHKNAWRNATTHYVFKKNPVLRPDLHWADKRRPMLPKMQTIWQWTQQGRKFLGCSSYLLLILTLKKIFCKGEFNDINQVLKHSIFFQRSHVLKFTPLKNLSSLICLRVTQTTIRIAYNQDYWQLWCWCNSFNPGKSLTFLSGCKTVSGSLTIDLHGFWSG